MAKGKNTVVKAKPKQPKGKKGKKATPGPFAGSGPYK
jgi:hypothetical protein